VLDAPAARRFDCRAADGVGLPLILASVLLPRAGLPRQALSFPALPVLDLLGLELLGVDPMNRSSMPARLAVLGLAITLGASAREAFAIKQFSDEFKEVYVTEGSPLAAAVETAKCNVCHKGSSKKDRNVYGEALAKLLDKKEDKDNKEKIRQALEAVAKESSDPANPAAPTFGALLAEGKLPGGPVE
jgi:hypothetical protein